MRSMSPRSANEGFERLRKEVLFVPCSIRGLLVALILYVVSLSSPNATRPVLQRDVKFNVFVYGKIRLGIILDQILGAEFGGKLAKYPV